jgi:diadenosine tetraphosphatase ApaH/serine/threonine PP2A family protein phosphatase
MPGETLRRLLSLDLSVHFIHGNGELAILAQIAAARTGVVTYWGTTSGGPLPEPYLEIYRWTVEQLKPEDESVLASWPKTLQLEIEGLGTILFCHGTPRSETEIFTRLTSEERLLPLFESLEVSVVVCGHTHMQFDRMIGRTRVVNAGSVGEPYGKPGAYWLLLGPDVQFQYTPYDLTKAADQIRQTNHPQAEESAQGILEPPSEQEMLEIFTPWELK